LARRKRLHDRPAGHANEAQATHEGSGPFVGQVGLFETANGLPHGPMAIVLAIAAAAVLIPLTRMARSIIRR
jgi:hypothetical protein